MTQEYCIYTDKSYDSSQMTPEHIIPLSLGGINSFSINVNSKVNKTLGSTIDGRLTNDYLISCLRRKNNFRGHSNKPIVTKLKNAKIEGANKRVQLIFETNSSKVYDLKEKKYLKEDETIGTNFNIQIPFDKHIRSLFVAKVALSAGYLIYGKNFTDFADHNSLRRYMDFSIHKNQDLITDLNLRFLDNFIEIDCEKTNTLRKYFNAIFNMLNCTAVKFALCSEHIWASVAISGQYMGSISFKADPSKKFPNREKFAGGHVIGIQHGHLKRSSFDFVEDAVRKKAIEQLQKSTGRANIED